MIDYIVGIIIAAMILLIIVRSIKKARRGESPSCGCGCSGCASGSCENSEVKKQ